MKIKRWLLITGVSALLTHVFVLVFTPYVMMGAVNLNARINDGYGKLLIRPQAVAGEDVVVRTSPDLLYSACAFNMNGGAYRISAPPIDSYMSVSIFAHNTDNFFAENDLDSPEGIDVVLTKKGTVFDLPEGTSLIETETPYGLILFRYYIGNNNVETFDLLRNQAKCEKFDLS